MKGSNIIGWACVILLWTLVTSLGLINSHVLPSPLSTLCTFGEMYEKEHLVDNTLFSLKINFAGYIESILFALPLGFLLGCFKTTNKLFSQPVDSLRFVPITALGGIFIALSGLTIWTKIHFLAFGIMVYLIPVVVQRVNEVSDTHIKMMHTLGASPLQIFQHAQWKYVISRLSDDIRILVGISWTYVIVAELKNVQGGLGYFIWLGDRQSNASWVYATLILIVTIGVIQDALFRWIDKLLFPFKYA
jgi:NitT/TauT family transport system permease protein